MIAVKTKINIEKVTNRRLRPSILFKYPTIKLLAAGITDTSQESFKSLVPIKPEGSKVPLYIVHGIGLNVLNFRGLAFNMDSEQPIYGLQAVDADDPIDPSSLAGKNLRRKDTVYNVSSGHNDMCESRYIKEIADLLRERINQIN